MNEQIYSVSQLNKLARKLLESNLSSLWLTGEISNFSQPSSGHWYLSLKDENAQVRCAMFRLKNNGVSFRPHNGMQVLVKASVSLYEPRGDYQLIIETMHLAGTGALQQQFEQLKMKLSAEGLFADHWKKALPAFCKAVGVITSPTGAALQDILHILARRDPSLKVVIYPTAVQGKEATSEIVEMIKLANQRLEVDVLIIGRGGGSLEDLWCFNEEIVARAIFHSTLPVISAVGHETDVTISDFVADKRASTPSAAAEIVSRDQQELLGGLNYYRQCLETAFDRFFSGKQQYWDNLNLRLQNQHPQARLSQQQKDVKQLQLRLQNVIQNLFDKKYQNATALFSRLENNPLPYQIDRQLQILERLETRIKTTNKSQFDYKKNHFNQLCIQLDSLSPLKVLSRGYGIVQNSKNKAVKSIQQVKVGEKIELRLIDGRLSAEVKSVSSF